MTVTYSLDVANTRFFGFMKLLCRWKGSIYKILWKELLIFTMGYMILSFTYRCILNEYQKTIFENVVVYCETFIDLIPLSFVLGFYVSLVMGRWWEQFDCIPFADKCCYMIATFVHGSDERSRMIRRSLGRYLILLQVFTFQAVSTAVKKRFPTTEHVVHAGLMTEEEKTIYEKYNCPYGKWWLPAQWFCSLAMRARKEGRIKDSVLLKTLIQQLIVFRDECGKMFSYDWISVPLVYTQVVTIATYTYALVLMIGRQYLDPTRGLKKHEVDLYVPFFTFLQFFFYIGWLKVAEQIVNPYGEDDDDFELNWCLDRSAQITYNLVDQLQTKHPKLKRDPLWDDPEPQLPHTKFSINNFTNPQLGSAANLEIDPTEAEFLPMETLLEEDNEANDYDSVKRSTVRYRPSFLMNILSAGLRQSFSRRPKGESFRNSFTGEGHVNPAFSPDKPYRKRRGSVSPARSRSSSLVGKRTISPTHSRASSISYKPGSISRHWNKLHELHQVDDSKSTLPNGIVIAEAESQVVGSPPSASGLELDQKPAAEFYEEAGDATEGCQKAELPSSPSFPNAPMPPIPEEPSRPISLASIDSAIEPKPATVPQTADQVTESVQGLVQEASKVIEELNRVISKQGHLKSCELKGYESCCSLSDTSDEMSDSASVEDDSAETDTHQMNPAVQENLAVIVDTPIEIGLSQFYTEHL